MSLPTVFKKLLIGRSFTAEKGRIRMFGKMDWILIPSKSVAINFQSIAEKNGPEFLYKMGYDAGKVAAEEMVKFMGLKPKAGWITQNAVLSLLEFIGFGRAEFVLSKLKPDGQHHFIFHIKDNPVIEHAREIYGDKSMVCNWFMGVFTAHGELEMGIKNGKIKENTCICKGHPYCEWETKWWKK